MRPPFYWALWPVAAVLCCALSSCSVWKQASRDVETRLERGDYGGAVAALREARESYGDASSVLYHLELGMLLHYAGQYDSSTAQLLQAEREIEELYTKSVSQAVASVLVNDNVLPYEGEDFEQVMLNVIAALNFAQLGETDEALVEARKVDLKLREISRRYDGENAYREDPFSRYLAGVLYENAGDVNDAFISYRLALEAYRVHDERFGTPTPPFLLDDLVRTATLMGFTEEARAYQEQGGAPFARTDDQPGRLLVLVYAGKGPVKEEIRSSVSIPDKEGTIHTFQIALPRFVVRSPEPGSYTMAATAKGAPEQPVLAHSVTAMNINAVAAQTLSDRLGLLYLKSGGRALLKYLAAEQAKKEIKKNESETANILGSIAVDILVAATEQADVRSWTTLPAEIQMGSLVLSAGTYDVDVSTRAGQLLGSGHTVRVLPGKTAFLIVEDVRSPRNPPASPAGSGTSSR